MNDLTNSQSTFFENVAQIIEKARHYVGRTADITMCVTYFEIGRMIVEEEQGGKARAEYGRALLPELSTFLNSRFQKGFSETNLRNARKFYQVYGDLIQQTLSAELADNSKKQKQQTISAEFENIDFNIGQIISAKTLPFRLGWSQYQILMRIKNEDERRFYELEAVKGQWSVEQLRRQYHSSLYERIALSRDKDEVMRLSKEGQQIENPRDILKNPLVLEFLDLSEDTAYSETKLEKAIISKLSHFLLELGKGFLFEARQKRFTYDEEHFKLDLVFYNRLLDCYVLFDLKKGKLKHQDLGQMQMYVNYYDRHVKTEKENPTIGILLCKEKNDNIVEMTLPADANIYASEYSLYLPDKALLQRKLAEWIKEFEDSQEEKQSSGDMSSIK
ncbi:MAG: PDDEXK nuclease domain-containing protein [Lachnospiraceae bacterium]|nr:PDDEXK nuclease domain-containing protein [Lachnospiraceae bacterium]